MSGYSQISGIKGWLLLPAISLIFKVLSFIVLCCFAVAIMINSDLRQYVIFFYYSFHLMSYMSYFLIWSVFIALANCYLAYLFFTKNYKTPRVYIILNSVDFVGFLVYWLVELNFNLYYRHMYSSMKVNVLIQLITTIIWVLYFCFSKRVKNTFIYE